MQRTKGFLFYKVFIYSTICFVILTSLLTLFFQTSLGKNYISQKLNQALEAQHWKISFEEMGGVIPFSWHFSNVKIISSENQPIFSCKRLYLRPYFFRLLQKQIAFRSLWIEQGEIEVSSAEATTPSLPDLPFYITIKSFTAKKLRLTKYPSFTWTLQGKLRAQKHWQSIQLKLSLFREDLPKSTWDLSFQSRNQQKSKLKVYANLDSFASFSSFSLPLDLKSNFTLQLDGSFPDFIHLMTLSKEKSQLQGKIWGEIQKVRFSSSQPLLHYVKGPWNYFADFTLFNDLSATLHFLSLENQKLTLQGKGEFASYLSLEKFPFQLTMPDLSIPDSISWPLQGSLQAEGLLRQEQGHLLAQATLRSPEIHLGGYSFNQMLLQTNAAYFEDTFLGEIQSNITFLAHPWSVSTHFQSSSFSELFFSEFSLTSPFCSFTGSGKIQDHNWIEANTYFSIQDLSHIEPIFPSYPLFGSAEGSLLFYRKEQKQNVKVGLKLLDLFASPIHAIQAESFWEVSNLYASPQVTGYANLQKVHLLGLELDQAYFQTTIAKQSWPFSLEARGEDTLSLSMQGKWFQNRSFFSLEVDELSGSLFGEPFVTEKPVLFQKEEKKITLSPLEIHLPSAYLFTTFSLTPEKGSAELIMEHFPLTCLSLNPLGLSVEGRLNVSAKMQKDAKNLWAKLSSNLQTMQVQELGEKRPTQASGSLEAFLDGGFAALEGKLFLEKEGSTSLSLSCPLDIEFFPFQYKIPDHKKLFGEWLYKAPIQKILDYVNFGPHRLKGDLFCHLLVDGTPKNPHWHGSCKLTQGNYENYYTGMMLPYLEASCEAKKGRLHLTKCQGKDNDQGNLSAKGTIDLDIFRNFPYDFEIECNHLSVINMDLVQAQAQGKIYIQGDLSKGKAKGTIQIVGADFAIPDTLPSLVPSLPITYIQEPNREEERKAFVKKSYPLILQLQVLAPQDVFIGGRGLHSQWRGNFLVEGTYDDIKPKGNLEIIHGNFLFSGKAFDLTHGSLTFTGKGSDLPFLDLTGKLEQSGITIFVSLKGKIDAPHLSFRSLPPLPVSSILSYLIFGQDISEISPLQVAQLAATAATLSGQGPDLFELTKKTLGLDRLAVISTPSSEGGTQSAALQVGKYLSKGILFSVSQGAAPSTSNVSIEVDLTHGFIFQAETLQQQEQGKFSLKWNHNY